MAQTKRKRRTKHRGTPAGTIEARGRTGRKPRPEERKAGAKAAPARAHRLDRPPTWRSAVNRGAIAGLIFFAVALLVLRRPILSAVALMVFALAIYIPMGYYTDWFVYRRRQRMLAKRREGA